jgi:hypothetical protein
MNLKTPFLTKKKQNKIYIVHMVYFKIVQNFACAANGKLWHKKLFSTKQSKSCNVYFFYKIIRITQKYQLEIFFIFVKCQIVLRVKNFWGITI